MSPENQQEIKSEKHPSDFKLELNSILNNPLTPENIDHYADSALDEIVSLTGRVLDDYILQTSYVNKNAETENAAYKYYQLGDISSLLDYISEKDREIKDLDSIIIDAKIVDDVIIPPEVRAAMNIIGGDGTFEKPTTIPRLKTLIFILENEFNIDPKSQEQFKLTKGILRDNMMRHESYYCVEAPMINRTTLVCDEDGNATFVFDNEKLQAQNITNQQLLSLTKEEIRDLIDTENGLGNRIIYSKNFVVNIVDALVKMDGKKVMYFEEGEIKESSTDVISYLVSKAPEGFKSARGISIETGVDSGVVRQAINSLSDLLGEANMYKFHSNTALGYSPEQQTLIINHLTERGLFVDVSPEGFKSVYGLSEELSISPGTVALEIKALGDLLGEVKRFKFYTNIVPGYSPEQQAIIIKSLSERGVLSGAPPEGYKTVSGFCIENKLGDKTVSLAIAAISDSLGEVKKYKFGNKITLGYSPEQQEKVKYYLNERGSLTSNPPEYFKSVNNLYNETGASPRLINKAIANLSDSLGEVGKYKFGSKIVPGYSPEQQEKIKEQVQKNRLGKVVLNNLRIMDK